MITKQQYVEYLVSTPINYTCSNLAEHLEDVSHDAVSNYLKRERHTARTLWKRIAGIVQRMRDFYRPPRGQLESHNLNLLLEDTLTVASLSIRQVNVQVIFTPDADLPAVVCDADQLRQVFLNLMLNAIEAMPEGGTLTVRTAAGPTVALVEIEDTGIGIPEAIRPKLFEPFFTNKPQGTGLGLSISAHIVTQHGGQIDVESQEGHGTTFRVALPISAASPER